MSTIKIAQRLVRTFGDGNQLRKVITETIGEGKTLTKVLDKDGNVVTERLKYIAPETRVGDKFVKTNTKVIKGKYEGDNLGDVHKFVSDRVYNEYGQLLGGRNRTIVNGETVSKNIYVGKDKALIANFDGGIRECIIKFVNGIRDRIECNYKGLPYPSRMAGKDMSNASLKEMRNVFQETFPGDRYAPPNFSFASFDEHLPDAKLTDLEQYL